MPPKVRIKLKLINFRKRCTFSLQNAKYAFFAPKCSLGPSGLTYHAANSKQTQESEGTFLRFLCWKSFLMENWFSIIPISANEFCNPFFVQKSSFRHFARNVTIVSPNGGPGGTNHSKCEKHNFPSFCSKVTFLLQKCMLESFLAFGAIFTLLAPNGPRKHQETITPTSFWATGPKKRILSSKIRKMLKIHPNAHFSKFN